MRGASVFRGYEGDDTATDEVFAEDGWLRTGDLGTIDDGIITLVERKKEIMVTASGKNVAPQRVENALCSSPLVSQAIAIGDDRPFVAALLVLDEEMVAKAWARRCAASRTLVAAARRWSRTPRSTPRAGCI